ncbi:hypothetical protein [Calidifontibacillus oryziterrae]|uniref:hypothetical protein n=1 Tax=Calidifontibacillus oryziterrae TaxID=1191699 RepID=UPI000308D163|nr:hypothetical protein [Calidifontibacillus oryziterrae]
MGNVEQIDQLETYIQDLGEEITKVKKASDYLKLIEEYQEEVRKTTDALNQSNTTLKLIQKIVDSKLELFQTTSSNIEAKQQNLEQTLLSANASLEELKHQLGNNEKAIVSCFKELNKLANQNQTQVVGEINRFKEEQTLLINGNSKTNLIFTVINVVFSTITVGMLVYLLLN